MSVSFVPARVPRRHNFVVDFLLGIKSRSFYILAGPRERIFTLRAVSIFHKTGFTLFLVKIRVASVDLLHNSETMRLSFRLQGLISPEVQ